MKWLKVPLRYVDAPYEERRVAVVLNSLRTRGHIDSFAYAEPDLQHAIIEDGPDVPNVLDTFGEPEA